MSKARAAKRPKNGSQGPLNAATEGDDHACRNGNDKRHHDKVFLDPEQKSPRAQDFEERLSARIVGQERLSGA